ncbi:hypothetical protein [Trichothermofontia sp.]
MASINGNSTDPGVPGVLGESTEYNGVLGVSTANGHAGVAGANNDGDGVGVYGRSAKQAGVYGESKGFNGVRGLTYAPGHGAVVGVNENHTSEAGPGVLGQSDGVGVWGVSKTWMGVYGSSESTVGGAGVMGEGIGPGPGVIGKSKNWVGVYGETDGLENGPAGVWGEHKGAGIGVKAVSNTGIGLFAFSNGTAGFFQGDVEVTGDIRLNNADCAEDFDIVCVEQAEPGTVMVIDSEGALRPSDQAYDKRVAGVISGAGNYKPGLILDKQESSKNRMPIALMGKVYCKVDASYGAIEVGDLLTTSPTPGLAMKATDPLKAFGSVIGKALRPLQEGQGLIPILIALQ